MCLVLTPMAFLCLSQAMTRIYTVIYHGFFVFNDLR
jgi:hypothetical protein